jgi:hypothetical protein
MMDVIGQFFCPQKFDALGLAAVGFIYSQLTLIHSFIHFIPIATMAPTGEEHCSCGSALAPSSPILSSSAGIDWSSGGMGMNVGHLDARSGVDDGWMNPHGGIDADRWEARSGFDAGLVETRDGLNASPVEACGRRAVHGVVDAGSLHARDFRATWWDRLEQLEPHKVHEGVDIAQDSTDKGTAGLLNSKLYDIEFVPEIDLQDLVAMEAKDKDISQQEFAGVDYDAETDDESITEEQKVRWLNQNFEDFKLEWLLMFYPDWAHPTVKRCKSK